MMQLSLPSQIKIKLTIDPQTGGGMVSCTPEDYEKIENMGMEVIKSAITIESLLNNALKKTLFRELKNDSEFVYNLLLESDKLTFQQKKSLLISTIQKFNLLAPSTTEALNKDISFVIRYRNAFAHGAIAKTKNEYILCYFSSTSREDKLDEIFWSTLQTTFLRTADALEKLYTPTQSPSA